jgi:small subunit ribosomal protein S5
VPVAIQKAMEHARRNFVQVELKNNTLFHPVTGYHGATKVIMFPASEGTGVIAGGAMRGIFDVLGVHNVLAKCYGSPNTINVVWATINGLTKMTSPELVAAKRGKSVEQIIGRSKENA